MEDPNKGLGIEWVVISKRRLYAASALLVLAAALAAGAYFRLDRYVLNAAADEGPPPATATRFNLVEGDVRVVRHETREVVRADGDTSVRPGDIVQTLESGRALVTLADGSTLGIRPNSVVTISENAGAREGGSARVRVAVDRGRVEVSTDVQPAAASHTVETRLSKNRLASRTDASFDVLDDRSEEVRVGSGSVESDTRAGRTTIRAGEYVALANSGAVSRREPLLDTPVLFEPAHLERIPAREEGAAAVTLQWTRPTAKAASVTYQVEIAASPFFVRSGVLFERQGLVSTKLVVTKLPPGNYFWRARAASDTGQASPWTGPQKFTIIRPGDTPQP